MSHWLYSALGHFLVPPSLSLILLHRLYKACCLYAIGLSHGPDKPRVDLGDRCSLVVQAAPREGCGCQFIHQLSTPIALSCPVTEMWLSSSHVPGKAEVFGRPERGETLPLTPHSFSHGQPGVLKPAEVTEHSKLCDSCGALARSNLLCAELQAGDVLEARP